MLTFPVFPHPQTSMLRGSGDKYSENNICPTLFSLNENVTLWLTEFPLMLAISFNFLNTPPAVRLAGWNIIRWLLRELSATRPKSPFSWASALILSSCLPGNKSQTVAGWWVEQSGLSSWSVHAQSVCVWICHQWPEQQLSSAPSRQRQAPSPGMQDPTDSNTGTHSTAGRLKAEHTHTLYWHWRQTVTQTKENHSHKRTGLQWKAQTHRCTHGQT